AAATTLMSASAAGAVGFVGSYIINKKKFYIPWIINSVLGGLVSITATCAVTGIWESLVIGSVGAVLVLLSDAALRRLHIDDPVSATSVHGVAGIWGLISAGFFTHKDTVTEYFSDRHGLVKGGGFYLLGVQTLACVVITAWSAITSAIILVLINLTVGLRVSMEEEILGSDMVEHNIQ
ncbi:ammonium transporter, partial [Elysia marginata]